MPTHDLIDFLNSVTKQIAEEYTRIQKRAVEDPGTAGDQGEENWASILRGWLPHTLHIVTKGRILSDKGMASPQVDIIILRPEYPPHLLDKKLYLAGGVLAAFECKVTLKATHIESFIKNSIEIKEHIPKQIGSPYKELQSPILYGLLAHSHSWKGKSSKPIETITANLLNNDEKLITHPRQMPDIVCVANLACWATFKSPYIGPNIGRFWNQIMIDSYGAEGCATSAYHCYSKQRVNSEEVFSPIGSFIYILVSKMAMNNPGLRPLAQYYGSVVGIGSQGYGRKWPATIYSDQIRATVQNGIRVSNDPYDEWCILLS